MRSAVQPIGMLQGKVAVVTGASKGIGLAITRSLAAEGVSVIAGALRGSPELDVLVDQADVEAVTVDLTSRDGPGELVAADSTKAIVSLASQALSALFQVPSVAMLVSDGKVVFLERVGEVAPQATDLEAARSSLTAGTIMRSEVYPNVASRFDFWPVETAEGQKAVVGLAFDPDERPSKPDELVNVIVSVLALVLDREHARVRPAAGP